MQAVANHLRLRGELRFVSELLKVTTTAATEVRTRRLDPYWRRRDDLYDRRKQNIPLLSLDYHTHMISRRGKRNKNRLPIGMGQPQATRQDSFDLNFKSRHFSCTAKRRRD